MRRPTRAFWRVVAAAEAVGAAYALVESLVVEAAVVIGSHTLPPSFVHGFYVFLLALGIFGLLALLDWSALSERMTRRRRRRLDQEERERKERLELREKIEKAYLLLRGVCEPGTIDPKCPGNPDYMRSEARDFANLLLPALRKQHLEPPPMCSTEDHSLGEWFSYLAEVRTQDHWADLIRHCVP